MPTKSQLESIAGNLATKTAANAFAVFGATVTPLAAFVPFLVDSLASRQQAERLEQMLQELNAIVQAHRNEVLSMSDDQYKVVNEAIAAAFYTVDKEKLRHLRSAAKNALLKAELTRGTSDALSRLVRDISASEVQFLLVNFHHSEISLWGESTPPSEAVPGHLVLPNSADEFCMSGLINLGLLYPKTSRWDLVAYEWSPLAAKLLALLSDEVGKPIA